MQEFIEALRKSGAKVDFLDLGTVTSQEDLENKLTKALNEKFDPNGPCPIHGEGPCPEPSDVTDVVDSAELLLTAKTALLGAITRINSGNSEAIHDRLAIADVAMELYDRVLGAEERAKLDSWGESEKSFLENTAQDVRRAAASSFDQTTDRMKQAREDAAKLREYQTSAPENIPAESHRERYLNGEGSNTRDADAE